MKENTAGVLFSLPFLLGFLFFILIPLLLSLYYSLCKYNIVGKAEFIGMKNYLNIFSDAKFWKSLKVTCFYAVVSVPLRVLFALLVALLLLRDTKATPAYRAMYYLPSLLGASVAVAILWKQVFAYDGLVNSIFGFKTAWLGDVDKAIWVIILLSIWQFGSSMLIFVSNLKQIPLSLYDAARVDGGSALQNFFKITLPLLSPTIFFNLVMQSINGLMVFAAGQIITGGKPMDSTLFYALYMYNQSFTYNNAGYGSALGWVLIVIVALYTAVLFLTKRFWVYEGGL
ncbi:MAG: sugar ABC transporter permease [Candidatus Limivivens sp.]|nr:sugar ABC transporter permease [Candidatus Limivivens sp.]